MSCQTDNQSSAIHHIDPSTLERIAHFNRDRNWDQYHNPKDLAISISLEAAELLECFQWSGQDLTGESKRKQIIEETADVLIYALQMCQVLNVNPDEMINQKLDRNEEKYPVEAAYGNALKYTSLQSDEQSEGVQDDHL